MAVLAVTAQAVPFVAFALAPIGHAATSEPIILAQEDSLFEYEDFQFWADQCLFLSQENDYQNTLETCERAISIRPRDRNLQLWTARSVALFNLERYAEAIVSFNQVLAVAPRDSISLAYQCAAYGYLNRHDNAVDTCEVALRANGNWGDRSPGFAWYHRGLALQEMGRLETALDSFARAVENQPENVIYEANRCALEIELGIALQTAPLFDTSTDNNPCNLREAISIYERALALEPNNTHLWVHQGLALEQLGDYERALTSYEQAISLAPDYAFALAHHCAVLNHLAAYEAALASCEAALQGDHRWERVGVIYGWTQHSRALIGLEDYEGAFASAKRAIDLSPLPIDRPLDRGQTDRLAPLDLEEDEPQTYPPAWNNLAVTFWHLEDYEQAEWAILNTLEQYRAHEPGLADPFERTYPEAPIFFYRGYILAYYNYGRIAASLGNHQLASDAYNSALQLLNTDGILVDPTLASLIYTHQAIAYFRINELDRSISSANRAVQNDPDSFIARYNQGFIFLEVSNYQGALRAYQVASQIQPDNIYALTGQVISLRGLGQPQEALEVLDSVLNLLPTYSPAESLRNCILQDINGANPSNDNTDAESANRDVEQLC